MKFYLIEAVDPKLRRTRLAKLRLYANNQHRLLGIYKARGDALDRKALSSYSRGDDRRVLDKTFNALHHADAARKLHAGNWIRAGNVYRRFRNRERDPAYKNSEKEKKNVSFSRHQRKLFKKIKPAQ